MWTYAQTRHWQNRFLDTRCGTMMRLSFYVVCSSIVLNHQPTTRTQVHCVQKYGVGNVCTGNSHSKVAGVFYEQQQRVRLEQKAGGAVRMVRNGDETGDVAGAVVGLAHVCQDSTTMDPRVPIISNAFPYDVQRDAQLDTLHSFNDPWRYIFSPFTAEIKADEHDLKLRSVMRALTWVKLLSRLLSTQHTRVARLTNKCCCVGTCVDYDLHLWRYDAEQQRQSNGHVCRLCARQAD
jgi:hypothetical protein